MSIGHRQEFLPLLLVERDGNRPSPYTDTPPFSLTQAHASTTLALEPLVLRLEPLEFGFQIFRQT